MPIFGSFTVHVLLGLGWDIVGMDPNSLTGSGCVSKSPSSDGRGGWFLKGTWNVLGSCELNRKSAVGCLGIIHRMEFSWCRRGVICLERSRWSWDVHCNSGCSNSLKFQERWCNYQKHSWPPSRVARNNTWCNYQRRIGGHYRAAPGQSVSERLPSHTSSKLFHPRH